MGIKQFYNPEGIDNASLKLICSDSSTAHMVQINLPDIKSDPLKEPYLDELNIKILEHYVKFIFSKKTDNGYIVNIQM